MRPYIYWKADYWGVEWRQFCIDKSLPYIYREGMGGNYVAISSLDAYWTPKNWLAE